MILKNKMFRKVILATSVLASSVLSGMSAYADESTIKIGLMLPYSGVYAGLGEAATMG